jgi:hypothetical protein
MDNVLGIGSVSNSKKKLVQNCGRKAPGGSIDQETESWEDNIEICRLLGKQYVVM